MLPQAGAVGVYVFSQKLLHANSQIVGETICSKMDDFMDVWSLCMAMSVPLSYALQFCDLELGSILVMRDEIAAHAISKTAVIRIPHAIFNVYGHVDLRVAHQLIIHPNVKGDGTTHTFQCLSEMLSNTEGLEAEACVLALLNRGLPFCQESVIRNAAHLGSAAIVDALLKLKVKCGARVLDTAVRYGHKEVVDLLLKKGKPCSEAAVGIAIHEGHIDIARALINKGRKFTESGDYQQRAISCAASRGDTDLVRLLLQKQSTLHVCRKGVGVNKGRAVAQPPCVCNAIRVSANMDIVRILLDAVIEAVSAGRDECVAHMLNTSPYWESDARRQNELCAAVTAGDLAAVNDHLARYDVFIGNAFVECAKHGRIDAAEALRAKVERLFAEGGEVSRRALSTCMKPPFYVNWND
jgi:hypothetical protein